MSGFLKFNIITESTVEQRLDIYDLKTHEVATQAMVENTESLLGKSMRIVPHDEGLLEGSGSARVNDVEVAHVEPEGESESHHVVLVGQPPPATPGSAIVGEVSYNKPYAARQHEELSYRHKEGRQAKYLENPLKEFVREFAQNIADAIRRVR